MVGAVQVEQDSPAPFEFVHHAAADEGKERVEAAHLLDEPLVVLVLAGLQRLPALRMLVKRKRGEDHELSDRHRRAQAAARFSLAWHPM